MSDYRPENNGYGYGNYDPYYRPEPPKKTKSSKIIAICLACIILAGAAGTGIGVLVASMNNVSVSRTDNDSSPATKLPEPTAEIPPSGVTLDTQIVDGSN